MKLLSVMEAAAVLGISKRTLQELTAARKLAKIAFGRNVRYDEADLARFVEAHRVKPAGWKAN